MSAKTAPKFVFEAAAPTTSTEVEANGVAIEGSVVISPEGDVWVKVGNIGNDGVAQKPWTNKAGATVKQSLLAYFTLGAFKVNGKKFAMWKNFHSQRIDLVRED
jgi:hypothetical protein